MVEGARLESVYTETYRGFESLLLRQIKKPPKGGFFVHAFAKSLGLVAKHIRAQVMATDLAIQQRFNR